MGSSVLSKTQLDGDWRPFVTPLVVFPLSFGVVPAPNV